MTVERILRDKGGHPATVAPEARIADAISALESEDVGALVVSADGRRVDGIISERDVVRGLQRFGAEILERSVQDLMTADVVTCKPEDRVAGVMALMDERKIRHVPVVDSGDLIAIVSIRDIIKLRLDEVQSEADAMRTYIAGSV